MKTTREEAYKAIDSEREYQDKLWQNQEGGPNNLTIGEFILLIEEYAAQARNAWSKEVKPEMTALNAVRKIAGIAVGCMEQHGAPHR